MKSIAAHHFPQVIIDGNKKWLFNPILKKRFANRPEERVRLRWVDYLLHQTGWKRSRIGFETPVKLHQEANQSRADIILYDRDLTPKILIECKAENISLTTKVAEQAARYNVAVEADYIALTNGVKDYWFTKDERKLADRPDSLRKTNSLTDVYNEPDYWSKRGFCSSQNSLKTDEWLHHFLPDLFDKETPWQTQYLPFKESLLPFPMDQYYKVAKMDKHTKIAMTTIGAKGVATCLLGILNRNGKNSGLISIHLDRFFSGQENPILVFKSGKKGYQQPSTDQVDMLSSISESELQKLPEFFMNVFD